MCKNKQLWIYLLFILLNYISEVSCIGEIVFAVNAGGEAHIDIYGIKYQRDTLHNKVGTASDFGKQLIIGRVPQADQILYQTERYHYATFGYEMPIKGDGDYVLVLKFSEVYFNAPNQKVSIYFENYLVFFQINSPWWNKAAYLISREHIGCKC